MATTNVHYYAAAFDAGGNRIASQICEFDPAKNAPKKEDLLAKTKKIVPNAAIVEIISSEDFCKYLSGQVRDSKTGKPVDRIPTAAEISAAAKAALTAEYEAGKAELLDSLQVAQLAGNADAVASIQTEYKEFAEAYKQAVSEVH